MEHYTIDKELSGERADKAVSALTETFTRSHIKKLIDDGNVTVNGKPVKPSFKLSEGDRLEISFPEAETIDVLPENIPLDIVYEDGDVIVINKPRNMVVHPAAGNYTGTLVNALLYHCGDTLSGINGVMRPGIVHRIDKDTTGLLVAAKGDKAHTALSEQLKTRTLKRKYLALVHNNIVNDSGTVSTLIDRHPRDRKKMAVVSSGGREAVTNYSVVERFRGYTLVNCLLDTGRTHQIRVHMKYMGNPVVGDKTYGVKNEEFNLEGQLLHAGQIGFVHPESGEYMEFSAPLPADFEKVLNVLRLRENKI